MKSIKILFTALLVLVSLTGFAQAKNDNEEYRTRVCNILQLDYSMPDYSTSRINSKVMGDRLAKILTKIKDNYMQYSNLSTLSVIQSHQIEDTNYYSIKNMKLNSVRKQGDIITIVYDTTLNSNALNIRRSQLVFVFVNGVSEDTYTNDLFINFCRYID